MSENDDHIGQEAEDSSETLDSTKALYELGGSIGGYKLLSILGEGGYGVVYLAEQQKPVRRRVALKVVKPGMDTKQVIARFETERQAWRWRWSSAAAHVRGQNDGLVDVAPLLACVGDWREYLAAGLSAEEAAVLRQHERTGRPLGGEAFLKRLERKLGRFLHKKPAGRRPKRDEK